MADEEAQEAPYRQDDDEAFCAFVRNELQTELGPDDELAVILRSAFTAGQRHELRTAMQKMRDSNEASRASAQKAIDATQRFIRGYRDTV